MAVEHRLYMDTAATRHELRDALTQASIGLDADTDLERTSGAFSAATNVTIVDDRGRTLRPDNGVVATRRVTFRDRKLYLDDPDTLEDFWTQTIQGVMALLRAFPEADSYFEGWDAERPMLLRQSGHLVLAEAQAGPEGFWGAKDSPERALVDLPYTVEPLGPWANVPVERAGPRAQPAVS